MLQIEFKKIIVDNISNSSGIFAGNNLHLNWQASSISNEGYGLLNGNNNRSLYGKSAIIKSARAQAGISTI